MIAIVQKINKLLDSIGGSAEGHFKVYATSNAGVSRTHVFLKADKLPLQPAIDLSFDLPGDTDTMVVGGINTVFDAAGVGNAPETAPPSN